MEIQCLKIAQNYELYKDLVYKNKKFPEIEIWLSAKQNHADWNISKSRLKHDTHNEIDFDIWKKKKEPKYSLKIFISELHNGPVYYFDSDGGSHRNTGSDVNLSESQIKTPHVNYYDEAGCLQAMRNEYIEKNETDLKENLSIGLEFFCSLIKVNVGIKMPNISIYNAGVFDEINIQIHEGIDFKLTEDGN